MVSDAAKRLTGLGEATTDGRLHIIDLVAELDLDKIVVQNPDRTDKDTTDSNTASDS